MVNYKKGYSLIELTIVVGLVSILSITISGIVLTTIVNSNRLKTKIRLRQAGDYAIGQLKTMLRNSREVVACDSTNNTVTIKNQDSLLTTIAFDAAQAQIASNAGIYLTPTDTETTAFNINCSPSDTDVNLVSISFTLDKKGADTGKAIENPQETFSTSAQIRNY